MIKYYQSKNFMKYIYLPDLPLITIIKRNNDIYQFIIIENKIGNYNATFKWTYRPRKVYKPITKKQYELYLLKAL